MTFIDDLTYAKVKAFVRLTSFSVRKENAFVKSH